MVDPQSALQLYASIHGSDKLLPIASIIIIVHDDVIDEEQRIGQDRLILE